VRFFDAALLSTAIGLTCSSVFLFASDYPSSFVPASAEAPLETSVPRSKDFIAIVIHGASTCRAQEPGSKDSRAHFLVPQEDANGLVAIEATPRWREQLTAQHTRNRTVNRRSVAVWVELAVPDAGPSPAQAAALARLVERLRTAYGIPAERVFTHAEVDVDVTCGSVFRSATAGNR
jgi:N-acetyl-anhydromuramyl-L-alanine amidase AmpD